MNKIVTCVQEGSYSEYIKRGNRYKCCDINEEKESIRIILDNGRIRWFPRPLFDLDGGDVVSMVKWEFMEEVDDVFFDCVLIRIDFNDGIDRMCYFATISWIANIIDSDPSNKGFWSSSMVIVKSISKDIIDMTLKEIDSQGCLLDLCLDQ